MQIKIIILSLVYFVSAVFFTNIFAQVPKEGMSLPPAIVEVAKVQHKMQTQQVQATGSLRASQGVMLRSEVDGRITQIYFKPGDNVMVGTKLIQLNQDILQANLVQSEAELTLAQQDYERISSLYKTRTVAKSDLDRAYATLKSKEAQVDGVKAQLRQKLLTAPFTGRVGLNLVDVGDYIKAGQDLVSLQTLSPIDAEFAVPEVYLGRLTVGSDVLFSSTAFPGQFFSGKMYAIDSLVNPKNRSITVRARIPNADGKLLPGLFAEVSLALGSKQPVLLIPQTAIVYDAGENYVYKIVRNQPIKTKVKLGERDQQNVVVLSGLKEGDTIVTAGQLKIHEGVPVIIVNSQLDSQLQR